MLWHITPFFLGTGDVWFSFRNRTYQNNSIVILEDIGEGDDVLLCITNQTACCVPPYTGSHVKGHWYFPNGTRVPSSGNQWDFHRTRGQMVVLLHHRRGGVEGIYRCEIPDTLGFTQTLYIGVYSASTGEWYIYTSCSVRVVVAWKGAGYPQNQYPVILQANYDQLENIEQ